MEIKINRFIFNRGDQTITCKIQYDGMMAHDEWREEKRNRVRRETESAVFNQIGEDLSVNVRCRWMLNQWPRTRANI